MAEPSLRILILTNHYPPDVNPSGKLMRHLAEGLRDLGHSVDVLTTFPHYESFRIDRAHRGKLYSTEAERGDRVTRVWAFASGRKQRMLDRLANYVTFNALASVAGLISRRKYDVVFANSGSFFTGITSWLLQLLKRTPFVYNVQDIYPDVPVRAGQLRSNAAIRGLENIEQFMYARARHVCVISSEQASVLLRKGVPPHKLSVIPNFVDTNFIRPLPRDNEVSRRLNLTGRFVVAHSGNLGFAYDFQTMLAAAQALRADARILFLIIGDGVQRAALEQQVQNAALDNVRMLPFQPEADLPQLRAASDVHLALYVKGAAESSLPSKIYEIMASARPAVVSAERGSELCKLVETAGCGICIEPENSRQLADAIRRLSKDGNYAALLGQRGREVAVRKYSKEAAVEAYEELLTRVAIIDKAKHAAQ